MSRSCGACTAGQACTIRHLQLFLRNDSHTVAYPFKAITVPVSTTLSSSSSGSSVCTCAFSTTTARGLPSGWLTNVFILDAAPAGTFEQVDTSRSPHVCRSQPSRRRGCLTLNTLVEDDSASQAFVPISSAAQSPERRAAGLKEGCRFQTVLSVGDPRHPANQRDLDADVQQQLRSTQTNVDRPTPLH